jgi:lipid II:glycine glycyltransferase (peptidoglycan interpeptide bridge formation enzyme)
VDKESVSQVIDALRKLGVELKCDFVRISPLIKNEPEFLANFYALGLKASQMHDVDAEVTWLLDLDKTPEEILKGMRDSHRYLTRKSLKMQDLEIIKTQDPKMVKDFWPIYEETFKRQKWTAYKQAYLTKEFEIFAKDNQVNLFLAKYQGKYIAASMFIYYRDQVYYHHSGSLTAYRNIPAMYRIHWESILEAQARGCKTYNFFGIARDDAKSHPWAGLTQFKKGFGGYQQEWMHAMDIPIKIKYWFTHYYELVERKHRGY